MVFGSALTFTEQLKNFTSLLLILMETAIKKVMMILDLVIKTLPLLKVKVNKFRIAKPPPIFSKVNTEL